MSGYDGHRTRVRRRPSATHAPPPAVVVEEPDDLAATAEHSAVAQPAVVTSTDGHPAEGMASAEAAAFVRALAHALHDLAPEDHSPDQLARLRAVLAVAAPAVVLTTTDPDLQETPVPTTTAAPSPKLGEGPAREPEVDHGQTGRAELDAAFAALAAERAATDEARAERDALLAEAADPVRATARAAHAAAAARQQVADEAAIADLGEALAFAQHQTASAIAHRLVALARITLTAHGLPAGQGDALALIPEPLRLDVPLTDDGQLDANAARTALDQAVAARLAAPR